MLRRGRPKLAAVSLSLWCGWWTRQCRMESALDSFTRRGDLRRDGVNVGNKTGYSR